MLSNIRTWLENEIKTVTETDTVSWINIFKPQAQNYSNTIIIRNADREVAQTINGGAQYNTYYLEVYVIGSNEANNSEELAERLCNHFLNTQGAQGNTVLFSVMSSNLTFALLDEKNKHVNMFKLKILAYNNE